MADVADVSVRKSGVFYGHWVLIAASLCVFISVGGGLYSFSLFIKPLQSELGWSRGMIMPAFTIWQLLVGLASPLVGRLVDRHGARRVIAAGAVMTGLGFSWLYFVSYLWQFYLAYAVIGTGMAAMGQVPASAVVSNWYHKKRGLAIGLMTTGVGIGGLVLAPLLGGYLIPVFGWRLSYLALTLISLVLIIPLTVFVIKTKPADMGLKPFGAESTQTPAAAASLVTGLTLKTAAGTSAFWLISVCFLATLFSQTGLLQTHMPYLGDIGLPVALVSTAFGIIGLGSAIGKFVFGWACDWIKAKYALTIGLSLQFAGGIILLNLGPQSAPGLVWLYVVLMGFGTGCWLPTMSILVSSHFGLKHYGAVFGAVSLISAVGSALGPLMVGYLYDSTGTYRTAFIILVALYLVAIPSILATRRPRIS